MFVTKEILEKDGNKVTIASTKTGIIYGSRGGNTLAEITLNEVDTKIFDAVVFIGGGGSKLLFSNVEAQEIARTMFKENKVVAAICLAPVILANAGILNGKNATVAGTEAETIKSKGANYTGPGVTVDGNIVTANAPKASRLFGEKISEQLS